MKGYLNENSLPPTSKKSWIKLFPVGLNFLDVAELLNILLISVGNWLTACLSDVFNGNPLWEQKWGVCEKDTGWKKAAP